MSKKIKAKLVVEVEYELKDDSAYNLITAFEDRVHRIMPQIVEHPSDSEEEHKAELIGWDFNTSVEVL